MNASNNSHFIGVDMGKGRDYSVMVTYQRCKSNGSFSMIREPYDKKQHPNQQSGLDCYVDVLDEATGNINSVKLYENKRGLHFKKGGTHYLDDFTKDNVYVPYQVREIYDIQHAVTCIGCVSAALERIIETDCVSVNEVPHADAPTIDECAMTRGAFTGIIPTVAYLNNTLAPYYTYELTLGADHVRINIHLPSGLFIIDQVEHQRATSYALRCDDELLIPTLVQALSIIDTRFIKPDALAEYADKVELE